MFVVFKQANHVGLVPSKKGTPICFRSHPSLRAGPRTGRCTLVLPGRGSQVSPPHAVSTFPKKTSRFTTEPMGSNHIVDGCEIHFAHFDTMRNQSFAGIYREIIILGFLRWCWISSIHSR